MVGDFHCWHLYTLYAFAFKLCNQPNVELIHTYDRNWQKSSHNCQAVCGMTFIDLKWLKLHRNLSIPCGYIIFSHLTLTQNERRQLIEVRVLSLSSHYCSWDDVSLVGIVLQLCRLVIQQNCKRRVKSCEMSWNRPSSISLSCMPVFFAVNMTHVCHRTSWPSMGSQPRIW